VTDAEYTAEERRWLEVWDDKRAQVEAGTMTPTEVHEWTWRNKVLNAINVTIQRIKRSEKPGHDPRRQDSTWVTMAAERGRKKEDMSPLAVDTLAYVYRKLRDRGHDFDLDWMTTANGVVVLSINIKELREFMNRKR
jgi:hypothetical protein